MLLIKLLDKDEPHPEIFAYRKDIFAKYGLAAPKSTDDVINAAKIIHENEDGILGNTELIQRLTQPTHIFVDVSNHTVKISTGVGHLPPVRLGVHIGNAKWPMWRISRNIAEKGLIFVPLNKPGCLLEPDIGTINIKRHFHSITPVGVVEVVVAPVIRRLTDPPATVIERLFKPTVMWSKRIVVA